MDDPVQWEDPKPAFAKCAAAIGHVHAEPDDNDSVTRSISLEKYIGRDRKWALAVQAFRLSRGPVDLESLAELGDHFHIPKVDVPKQKYQAPFTRSYGSIFAVDVQIESAVEFFRSHFSIDVSLEHGLGFIGRLNLFYAYACLRFLNF
jgi:hypothetical protein